MNKEDVGSKRPLSHGNVTDKPAKEKESAEIEAQTKEYLKKNKITQVSNYDE